MGWSLKGIIGGALVGGAGAAEKHFVAEDNMARELAAKKEMADYTSEIEFNKTKRLEEWRAANKDTGEMRECESISENTALASDAAIAAGEKPGTVSISGHYSAQMIKSLVINLALKHPEFFSEAVEEMNKMAAQTEEAPPTIQTETYGEPRSEEGGSSAVVDGPAE